MLRIYKRVSTIEQAADDRSSLENQDQIGRGFAMSKGMAKFDIAIYEDKGVSASVPLGKRPAGRRMLDDLEKGDIVFASKLDRMFRSALDSLYMIEAFKKQQVDLVLFDLGSEPVGKSAISQCFFMILSAFAELERNTIKERCKNGREAKIAKGGHAGGEAPYGWRIVGEGREARREIVSEEQDVLERVRAIMAKNPRPTFEKMCGRLASEGLRNRDGKPFRRMQVWRMVQKLENQVGQSATG